MHQPTRAPAPGETPTFSHSPDYRCIKYDGEMFYCTPKQSQVIQFLHEQYEQGTPEISGDYILEHVLDGTSRRLRDVFKSNPE